MTLSTIQKATLDNLNALAGLLDLYRQFYEQKPDYELAKDFIYNRLSKNESVIFISVEADETITGFCQLYPTFCSIIAEPIFILSDLFVAASKRKFGIGRALLLAAEHYAKSNGFKRMDLTTAKTNYTAQSLYESLGWERENVYFTYNRQTLT